MSAEQITIETDGNVLHAMVERTANGWGAACRFIDADYMVSHADSRDRAISALERIVSGDLEKMANNPDKVMSEIGARWEIRSTRNRETT